MKTILTNAKGGVHSERIHHRDTAEVHSARLPDGSEATNVTACGPLSKLLKLLKARSWPSITAARFTMFELSDALRLGARSRTVGVSPGKVDEPMRVETKPGQDPSEMTGASSSTTCSITRQRESNMPTGSHAWISTSVSPIGSAASSHGAPFVMGEVQSTLASTTSLLHSVQYCSRDQ